MLTFSDRLTRLCDGLTRRQWLHVGAFGLSLPRLWQARAAAAPPSLGDTNGFGKAKSCIVLFLLGGPPQHETWDPKPEAPPEIRGPYKPIASRTPGLSVCELMPLTANLTDKIAVLRAMSTGDSAHSSSGYWMLTGYPHTPMNFENARPGAPNDWPCVGAVVERLIGKRGALPAAVRLPEEIWNTGHIVWPGQDGGFLGRQADPWLLHCDPNKPDFQVQGLAPPIEVSHSRFAARQSMLQRINRSLDAIDRSGAVGTWDHLSRQAFDLMSSGPGRRAFDLNRESPAVRDRYGRNRFGQSVLLARRLVEAGVSLVQVNWQRWEHDTASAPAWDSHAHNAERLKKDLMPPMDLAYSALLDDLSQRGMLDETLVVWMGEFGRTPRYNSAGGRDHWGHVFSVALAGGGIKGGVVHGASDRIGAMPKDGKVDPSDLSATIFHCLGHRPDTEIRDNLNRPLVISKGEVIRQVV